MRRDFFLKKNYIKRDLKKLIACPQSVHGNIVKEKPSKTLKLAMQIHCDLYKDIAYLLFYSQTTSTGIYEKFRKP